MTDDPGWSAGGTGEPGSEISAEERNFAVLAHLGALAGFMIPFGHVAAPLLIWLFKKNDSTYIEHHARESLNFQISVTIYGLAASLLGIVLVGFVLLALLLVFAVVMVIVAAMSASRGELYRYRATIRLIA